MEYFLLALSWSNNLLTSNKILWLLCSRFRCVFRSGDDISAQFFFAVSFLRLITLKSRRESCVKFFLDFAGRRKTYQWDIDMLLRWHSRVSLRKAIRIYFGFQPWRQLGCNLPPFVFVYVRWVLNSKNSTYANTIGGEFQLSYSCSWY